MSIIQTKLAAGTLKGWWDYRAWHVDDLSGNANDGSFTGSPRFSREGLDFSSGNNSVNCGTGLNTLQAVTVACWFRIDSFGTLTWLFNKYASATDAWGVLISAGGSLGIYNDIDNAGASVYAASLNAGQWHHMAAVITATKEQKLYLDGVLVGSGTATADFWDSFAGDFTVGSRVTTTSSMEGPVKCCQVFSEELDITEIGQLMGETLAQRWPTKPMGRVCSKGLSGVPGLLKAWMMKPQGATVPEAVSGVSNGTIEGNLIHAKTLIGDSLRFCANNERIGCGVGQLLPAAAFSTAILCKPITRGEGNFGRFFEAGVSTYAAYIASATTGNLRYAGSGGGTNLGFTGLVLGQWTLLLVTYDGTTINIYLNGDLVGSAVDTITLDAAQPFFIGSRLIPVSRAFDGPIAYLQHFDHALTEAERTRLYEHSLGAIQFRTDWGTPVTVAASVGAGAQLGPFMVDSGAFKITTDTIEGKKTKVIECVTAGDIYVDMLQWMNDTEAAHGTWEVYVYKANTADDMDLAFIADTIGGLEAAGQDGYGFRYANTDDGIYLYKSVAGGITDLGHFIGVTPAGAWYLLHLDRTVAGLFSMWIGDDSGVGSALDTTTTTGRYMAIEMAAGGKVALADVAGGHSIIKRFGVVT